MTDELDPSFEILLTYLKEQRGFDFTGYKRPSLVRRVRRRMDTVAVPDFDEYLEYLELHPGEFTALFNTILINVTSFFRDTEAWTYLRDVGIPDMLSRRADLPVRAWSAGCATGQEAYSMAMLLAEALGIEQFRERVKIYATDVDEEALAGARQAIFTEREVAAVPADLLEKYFEPTRQNFTIRKELRRAVIFGRNDLVKDAPISHVDFLSCRNTLMYFNAQTQASIVRRLHFALRPGGLLFLGKAELLLSHSPLFEPVDLRGRLFRPAQTEVAQLRQARIDMDGNLVDTSSVLFERIHEEALRSAVVPQIVLDVDGRLVVSNYKASQLFGIDVRDIGRPIKDLEVSYRPVEIRTHIEEALRARHPVWVRDVAWHRGPAETLSIDVQLIPLSDDTGALLGVSVIYHDVSTLKQLQGELKYANRQVETAYEEVQSTNEELETTNEELQSTVEELETTNEELQSTNEELETMNAELQSMNDELQMSNDGLRDRQDEVDRLNVFLGAVLGSLRSGIAVVDAELRVQSWNTGAEELWGLRSDETVGCHIAELDIGLPVGDLRATLERHLRSPVNAPESQRLQAVNRRGHAIVLDVTVMRLGEPSDHLHGAIIVMDVLDDAAVTD